MARESKRVRDERRFGRPERLADMIDGPWYPPANAIWHAGYYRMGWSGVVEDLKGFIRMSKVFDVTNVAEYVLSNEDSDLRWNHLPSMVVPFDDFFIECGCPDINKTRKRYIPEDGNLPRRWGVYCHAVDREHIDELIPRDLFKETLDTVPPIGAAWGIRKTLVTLRKYAIVGPICVSFMFLDRLGNIIGRPMLHIAWEHLYEDRSEQQIQGLINYMWELEFCLLMGLAFMNCKNVSVVENQPDRRINRERRDAGLKPFVRYHTINIEPMKKVLRTEGNIETEGIKKALHICRGHFATYSEERPLFGKVSGTFWVPAHVRGSADKGVVFSDYKVNPKG